MKTGFVSAISLSMLLMLSSCEKESFIAPVEEVMPLQVGNEWVYKVTDYDTNGNLLTTSSYRNTVQKDTLIQNSTWYILSSGQIVQNSREGYVYLNKADSQPVVIYQAPNYGGIGYMYQYNDYDLRVMTTRQPEPDTVTTGTATFSSYVFSIENQYTSQFNGATHTINQEDYVAPGVGLVRIDKHYADSEKVMQRHELVRYTVH